MHFKQFCSITKSRNITSKAMLGGQGIWIGLLSPTHFVDLKVHVWCLSKEFRQRRPPDMTMPLFRVEYHRSR